jgi:transposase
MYSDEFKRNALELIATSGKSVSQLEQDLGLSTGLLYKWREKYQVSQTSPELELNEVEALKAEIRRLKRENQVLTQEGDILKKAVSIFSKDAPA